MLKSGRYYAIVETGKNVILTEERTQAGTRATKKTFVENRLLMMDSRLLID